MSDLRPTDEQQQALDLFAKGQSLAIEAGAGTGKTSTLTMLARQTERTGQYVAFNKAIVTDAGAKMPGSVTASTAHSLAFRAVGHQYKGRLNSPRMKSMEMARQLRIDPVTISYGSQRKVMSAGYLAGLVMAGIGNYCMSADTELSPSHLPYIDGIDVPTDEGRRTYGNNDEVRAHLLPAMVRAWSDLMDPKGTLPYKHDHYLKAWHLSGPRIYADFILFDEAQDANPVLIDVVAQQTEAQLVWVGDSQQAIYTWRGAVNALAAVPADQRTFLSQSFRFGQRVADVANDVLGMLHAEMRLRGNPDMASVVGPVPMPDAILCRTNAKAVTQVLSAQREGKRVHLVGGGVEVVSFAKAADELRQRGQTFHPELACFDSWLEVQEYVEHDEQGGDLRLLVSLVDEFGTDTIVRALGAMPSEANAELIVSTGHKAKGREWPSVKLLSDFGSKGEDSADEELRLLYVAVTRARQELDCSGVGLLVGDADTPNPPVTAPSGGKCCPLCFRTDVVRKSTGLVGVHKCEGVK